MLLPRRRLRQALRSGHACTVLVAAVSVLGCGDSEDKAPEKRTGIRSAPPSLIAYQTDRSGQEGIWLVRSDGSGDHEVATSVADEHLHPNWSPDGKRLLFTKRAAKDLLFEADAQGRHGRQIIACKSPCIGDDEASYSPDGQRIAFIRAIGPLVDDHPQDCALWVFSRRSRRATRLARHRDCRSREAFPRWSPDGSTLVYFRDRSDENNVTAAPLCQRHVRRL